MSTDDLSILAAALTFALLVTMGGLIMWAVARATWRRGGLRRTMKVGVSTSALVAVGLAGVVMWPATRDGVNSIPGLGPPQNQAEDPSSEVSPLDLVPPSPKGPAREFTASPIGTDESNDPAPIDPTDPTTGPSTGPPTIAPSDPPTSPPSDPTDPPTQPPPTDPPTQPPPTDPPSAR